MAASAEAQAIKAQGVTLIKQAQSKLDEWKGKIAPTDALQDIDRLFDEGQRLINQAEATAKSEEKAKYLELPDDMKKLEAPEIKNNPAREDAEYDKILEKYNLKRWEIRGIKQSCKTFNAVFEQTRKRVLEDKGIEYKALSESAATSGATLTPDIFVPEFVNKLYQGSALRQAGSRVVPLKSDITRYPRMTTASGAASLISEAGNATATNATVGEVVFTAYMFRALQQASLELVADAEFDVLSELILPDMAQQFAAAENSYFTLGNGTSAPQGLTVGATVTVSWATSATNLSFDDVINVMHGIPPQYRTGNTAFMCHDDTIKMLRKIKATSAGTYIWEPSQQVGQPDTVYGRPVYYNQSMANAYSANTLPLVYGNFDYFWIGDRAGLDVRTANELYLVAAQVGWFAFKRVDSRVMQAEAFAVLKGA